MGFQRLWAITFLIRAAEKNLRAVFHHWVPSYQKRIPALNFREGINFLQVGLSGWYLFLRCIFLNIGIWRLFDVFWKTACFCEEKTKIDPKGIKKIYRRARVEPRYVF